MTMMPIPKGYIFYFSSGEYSDYNVPGVFRALKEINPDYFLERYLSEFPEQREEYSFERYQFINWLLNQDLIESIDHLEWHLDNYSNSSEMDVDKPTKWWSE
jgi:hypothetical protein